MNHSEEHPKLGMRANGRTDGVMCYTYLWQFLSQQGS